MLQISTIWITIERKLVREAPAFAGRAGGRLAGGADQRLELVAASVAFVAVDWHGCPVGWNFALETG